MTSRIFPCAATIALAAQVCIVNACGGSNDPIIMMTTGVGGHVDATGTGGTTAPPAGTGGALTSAGTGGALSTTGTGGNMSTSGTGGNMSTADGGTAFGQPACPTTVAKGGDCAATDPQLCYKTCGPEKTGVKSETCSAAKYAEMSGCSFDPAADYTCYKIPTASNAACPAGVMPAASSACTVDHCVLCNSTGGLPGGMYSDSGGMAKTGYCVCQLAGSSGTRNWSCASDTAWPCPLSKGC